MTSLNKNWLWYILPAVFSIIGGVITFYILRKKDPTLGKNCLILGSVLTAFYLAYYVVFWVMLNTFEFS